MDGSIVEFAMWEVALSADEIAALAAGKPPTEIRPENLVEYQVSTE